jgi:D-inositol-3-phosphate glycosyltransferase
MKALYFNGRIFDNESEKAMHPAHPAIRGADLYRSQVAFALARHGTYDHYFYAAAPRSNIDSLRNLQSVLTVPARVGILASDRDVGILKDGLPTVMMSPSAAMHRLARIRARTHLQHAVITGVVHSLDGTDFLNDVIELGAVAQLKEHDAVFVSSRAGKLALCDRLDQAIAGQKVEGRKLKFKPQLLEVPLGVDGDRFRRHPQSARRLRQTYSVGRNSIVILYFGRFSPFSKADLVPLLIAFAELRKSHRNIVLFLAGDDTELRMAVNLAAIARQLQCDKNVRIIADPTADQKLLLFAGADMFVSPTDCIQETFGITVIEAMAASLPVVASDWNGYRDIVVPDQTGFLIPTMLPGMFRESILDQFDGGSATERLAASTSVNLGRLIAAIRSLVTDRELRLKFGDAGRKLVESTYNWSRVIARYEELWGSLSVEAARCQKRTERALNVNALGIERMFRHYSTATMKISDVAELNDLGSDLSRRLEMASVQLDAQADIFDSALLRHLYELVLRERRVPLADLVSYGVQQIEPLGERKSGDESVVMMHIARLAKYGVINVLCLPMGTS